MRTERRSRQSQQKLLFWGQPVFYPLDPFQGGRNTQGQSPFLSEETKTPRLLTLSANLEPSGLRDGEASAFGQSRESCLLRTQLLGLHLPPPRRLLLDSHLGLINTLFPGWWKVQGDERHTWCSTHSKPSIKAICISTLYFTN